MKENSAARKTLFSPPTASSHLAPLSLTSCPAVLAVAVVVAAVVVVTVVVFLP